MLAAEDKTLIAQTHPEVGKEKNWALCTVPGEKHTESMGDIPQIHPTSITLCFLKVKLLCSDTGWVSSWSRASASLLGQGGRARPTACSRADPWRTIGAAAAGSKGKQRQEHANTWRSENLGKVSRKRCLKKLAVSFPLFSFFLDTHPSVLAEDGSICWGYTELNATAVRAKRIFQVHGDLSSLLLFMHWAHFHGERL